MNTTDSNSIDALPDSLIEQILAYPPTPTPTGGLRLRRGEVNRMSPSNAAMETTLPIPIIEMIVGYLADRDLLVVSTLSRQMRTITCRPRPDLNEEELAERGDLPRLMAIERWKDPPLIIDAAVTRGHFSLARYAIRRTENSPQAFDYSFQALPDDIPCIPDVRLTPSAHALYRACQCAHYDFIDEVTNRLFFSREYAFTGACAGGHVDIATQFGGFIRGITLSVALVLAAENRQLETVRFLLRYDPPHVASALDIACFKGFADVAETLGDHGAGRKDDPHDFFNDGLRGACRGNQPALADAMIGRGATAFHRAATAAAVEGNTEMVMAMIGRGADRFGCYLEIAFRRHYRSLVEALLDRYPSDINNLIPYSCGCGSVEFAKLLFDHGATDYAAGFQVACSRQDQSLAEFIVDNYPVDINRCLVTASSFLGTESIVEMLIGRGANNLNECLLIACCVPSLPSVRLLIERGANNLNEGIRAIVEDGIIFSQLSLKIGRYLIQCGATDWDTALRLACIFDDCDFASSMIEKGASNLAEARRLARASGKIDIIVLIEREIHRRAESDSPPVDTHSIIVAFHSPPSDIRSFTTPFHPDY